MGRNIGIILIILIALLTRRIQLEGMEQRKGIVTDIEMVPTGRMGRSTAELPIATFQHYDGKQYQSRKDIGAKFYNNYDIGDSITVYFPKSQPKLAEIYSFTAYWLSLPFISIVLLIIIAWLGIHNLITMHSRS